MARVESKLPFDHVRLQADYDLQDIISVNLERVVQNAVDIATLLLADLDTVPPPATMTECFNLLCAARVIDARTHERMRKAVGFRNILVHEYASVDWLMVHTIATHHLDDFREYVRAVIAWLDA